MYEGRRYKSLEAIKVITDGKEISREKITLEIVFHSQRVSQLSYDIADTMKLSHSQKLDVATAAMCHDFGKTWIKDELLNKPGKLNREEYEEVKKHALYSSEIVKRDKNLAKYSDIVLYHHEKIDGSGYFGLVGNQIHLLSKIIAVADVFDALCSDRSYRKAHSINKALEKMYSKRWEYDKDILAILIDLIEKKYRKIGYYKIL